MNCVICDHPMRPNGSKAANHPGTRAMGNGTSCSNCTQRKLRADARAERAGKATPRPCHDCGRNVRPSGYALSEMPGTVPHYSGGRCKSCHNRQSISRGFSRLHADRNRSICSRCPQPHGWTLGASTGLCPDCNRTMAKHEKEMWVA